MSKYIPGNQKHLTLEDRKYIEKSLNTGCSFKDITRYLCKDPTTISKEIRLHRLRLSDWYHKGCFNNAHNFCIHRYHCKKVNACGKIILCGAKCTTCPTCNQTCPDFIKERCNRLDKAPYVCNGCPKAINHCTIAHKYRYDAIFADRKYKECLSQSRAGINMTRHELHQKDMVITPLIFQGQSPYQIVTNHPELDLSVRILYSYLVGSSRRLLDFDTLLYCIKGGLIDQRFMCVLYDNPFFRRTLYDALVLERSCSIALADQFS